MKKHFIKNLPRLAVAVFAIAAAGIFTGVKTAWADDIVTSMFVSPMKQELLLVPGEEYTGIITVSNAADASENLKYSVKIGSYNLTENKDTGDDYGAVDVQTKTEYNVMMDWISVSKDSGTVAPNDSDHLSYTIKIPENAPAGAQYASILIIDDTDSSNGSNEEGYNIKSKMQIASAIYANVAGETVEKGSIKENSMPSILTTGNLEATSMVRNDGNIYTDATYTLQVWPLFSDEEICTNEEDAETSLILPNTERYHVQSCNLPMVGIFKAKQVVSIFGEESVLEKTIIVCPVWLMILILVIIIAIIAAIIIIIRKNSKKVKKSEE